MAVLDARGFLAALFPAPAPGETIEIRPIAPGGAVGPRRWFAAPHAAAAYARGLAPRWNVYVGVNPRRAGGGTKAAVTSVRVLHADVDDKRFPAGRVGALAALAHFPLPATIVVSSGGGLQPYWTLVEPLAITSPTDIARVEGLLARLYARLGGLDAVQDLSRVLRVPDTLNHKYDPPRPVVVLDYQAERRYTLEQFEALLPAPPPPPARPAIPGAPYRAPGHAGVPSRDEVRELLRHIPPRGDYTADWLRVLAAVHSLYPGAEGVALCEEWSPGTPGEVARKFRSFGRYQGERGPAGAGTLFHLAKRGGWRPPPVLPRLRGVRYV